MKFDPNETLSRIKNDKILTPEAGHGSEVDILFNLGTKYTSHTNNRHTDKLYAIISRFVGVLHAQLRVLRIAYELRKTNEKPIHCNLLTKS